MSASDKQKYEVWVENGKTLYGISEGKEAAHAEARRLRKYKYANRRNMWGRVTVREVKG